MGIQFSAVGELRRRAKPYLSALGPFKDLWIKDLRDLAGHGKVQVNEFYLFKHSLENSQQPFWCLLAFGFYEILCFTLGGCPRFY